MISLAFSLISLSFESFKTISFKISIIGWSISSPLVYESFSASKIVATFLVLSNLSSL